MAFTGTELLMNADLFRMTFPEWPGVRSQAPVPDDDRLCDCGHVPAINILRSGLDLREAA